MKLFKNFKEAHEHYNFPFSHRIGTIHNDNGVIRSYSNGEYDIEKDNYKIFYYKIKNDKIKEAFLLNKTNNKALKLFVKVKEGVLDLGKYIVDKFYKGYVKLLKK
uniref:Uncharacterized protein n=1 Tax=viral metagenome TaxID=1070528 RepID=A0A6C0AYZ1_9ZZZZ|tara:strand:- start:21738 stop:22052 length:315 start_codon:yes stop_codon:yes gene_type:complete